MPALSISDIQTLLPHRFPFLLVDRVIDFQPNEWIHAYKNITVNESFFQGHFPDNPLMPGVLIIEAIAQTCGLLGFLSIGKPPQSSTQYVLVGADDMRFKAPVIPGDRLSIHAKLIHKKRGIWKFDCVADVDKKIVSKGQILIAEKSQK
ncbi:MAG: 3-hydroxyacyl-ACP dehydratase FabZ [Pseudomonadota bacterium]